MTQDKANKIRLYYETLDPSEYIRYFFRNDTAKFLQVMRDDMGTDDVFLMSSGRAGIFVSLAAAGIGRHDEVFVPPFMSPCVLDAVHRCGFPSLQFSERTKAVLLHHHWGYPQDFPSVQKAMAGRNIPIVEDCAHGFWGKSNGITMGAFGDTALFSPPKIFEVSYAGVLRVNNPKYLKTIEQRLSRPVSWRERWETFQGERTYVNFYKLPLEKRSLPFEQIRLSQWYAALLVNPVCAQIRGRLPYTREELKDIFKKQNTHFLYLLESFRNRDMMLAGDSPEEMAPLCYPFFHDDEAVLKSAVAWLKARNIFVGIYHFDVNRNMFHPNYRKCVPVPLYASLREDMFQDFVKQFKGER